MRAKNAKQPALTAEDARSARYAITQVRHVTGAMERHEAIDQVQHGTDAYYAYASGVLHHLSKSLADLMEKALAEQGGAA